MDACLCVCDDNDDDGSFCFLLNYEDSVYSVTIHGRTGVDRGSY